MFTREELDAAAALVHAYLPPTPQQRWPLLEQETGVETWVKHENATPVGAFKVRGGLVHLTRLREQVPGLPGVVSATRGNHGQSLAFAGRELGVPVVIVVPEGNNPEKNAAMLALGAEVVVRGRDFQAAREAARELSLSRGLVLVASFHRDLVMGVATYALEFLEACPTLDVVYVPIGMGSGAAGLVTVRDLLGLPTRVVGVVADSAPAYELSWRAGRVVSTEEANTFVDGVACRVPDPDAFAVLRAGLHSILRVRDDATASAMRSILRTTHTLVEPAGALGVAALLQERPDVMRAGVVITGGNVDAQTLSLVLAGETPAA